MAQISLEKLSIALQEDYKLIKPIEAELDRLALIRKMVLLREEADPDLAERLPALEAQFEEKQLEHKECVRRIKACEAVYCRFLSVSSRTALHLPGWNAEEWAEFKKTINLEEFTDDDADCVKVEKS